MSQTVTLIAPDISCEHCQRAIEQALNGLPGVDTVAVDVSGKSVTITYDPGSTSPVALSQRLDDEGYPVATSSSGDNSSSQ